MASEADASGMIRAQIDALLIGTPKMFRGDGTMSAMARSPVDGPVALGFTGFAGDQVADPRYHGGRDKAVHFYPAEHYPVWRKRIGDHPLLSGPGAFGENLSAKGLTEDRVRIGDRFTLGSALVEVAQGRQPCWKLDHHFARATMAADVITTGMGGLYFRVIEPGEVAVGDAITQVASGPPEWTVARVFTLLIGGGHKHAANKAALRELAALDVLAENWRARAARLAGV